MKTFLKSVLVVLAISVLLTGCEKYTYTPLYPTPAASYYQAVYQGAVYNGNLILAGANTDSSFITQWNGSSWSRTLEAELE